MFLTLLFTAGPGKAQADTSVYERIMGEVSQFKPNFSSPPSDRITEKIREFRNLRGGFNIREAIAFKLQEDRNEKKMPEGELDALSAYLTNGEGAQAIDNAVTWIYREHFTLAELKQLIKFYKTSAGKKMSEVFPIIMMKSLLVAESVKEKFTSNK